jgi:hypothetical protein
MSPKPELTADKEARIRTIADGNGNFQNFEILPMLNLLLAEIDRLREERDVCLPWTPKRLHQFVQDICDDTFECLPKCDSYGHEENCPVTNPVAAFRQLIEERDTLKARIEKLEAGLRNLVRVNQEWNVAVATVIGRPVNWNADYLKEAKSLLASDTEESK